MSGSLKDEFMPHFERVKGVPHDLQSMDGVPGALSRLMKKKEITSKPVIAPHEDLEGLDWQEEVSYRPSREEDEIAVSRAVAGLAETGTLVFFSGQSSPPSLNFVPEIHVVILREDEIVPRQEDAWALLEERKGPFPSTINLVTGPSRTGDIEQTLYLGAHGPKEVHLFLIGE